MSAENIRAWVEALRSGEFAQGTGSLRPVTGYCCLGVACEVYRRKTGAGCWRGSFFTDDGGDWSADGLPSEVQEWLGGVSQRGRLSSGEDLAELNDRGLSFAEIADLIEREYLA